MENMLKIKLSTKTVYYTKGDDYTHCLYNIYIKNNLKDRILLGKKYQHLGQFYISRYFNCCGISILNNVVINWQLQGQGYGNLLVQLAIKLCDTSQFQTTNTHSPKMDHLLVKYGFQVMNKFVNHKTGNTISLYYLNKVNLSI